MTDIDRMFRSELAVLAEHPTESDLWALDDPRTTSSSLHTDWDLDPNFSPDPLRPPSPRVSEQYPLQADTALGLFPAPNRRLGGSVQPVDPLHISFTSHLQPTVHLSDVSLVTTAPVMPVPVSMPAPVPSIPAQIPIALSPSCLSDSPTDPHVPTDLSSEDVDSDDLDLGYPSDSDFVPSPARVNPDTFSAASMDPRAMATVRPSRRRSSRAMTNIPVPIPNLTKKSRGRKVPTSSGGPVYAASRDKTKKGIRTYTCQADGCGKCFVRGEHLKRHIRSIHTDEKPWMCTYENCTRAFSRRDNLNQHLRVHKIQNGAGDD